MTDKRLFESKSNNLVSKTKSLTAIREACQKVSVVFFKRSQIKFWDLFLYQKYSKNLYDFKDFFFFNNKSFFSIKNSVEKPDLGQVLFNA